MAPRIDDASAKDQILIQWYHTTAGLKAKAACAYIENLLKKTDEKILAFAHHGIMINAISAHLEKLNVPHIRIEGSTNGSSRSERVDAFQKNSNIRVAVLSTLAANAGITLTSGSTVVFCELEFNPSTIIQAEGRAHRIGQKKQVKVHFLLAPGTADDVIWKMLMKKQANLGQAGLVDSIEYLSNTMKVTKFDLNVPDGESSEEAPEESDSDESETFYSCATTVAQSPLNVDEKSNDENQPSTSKGQNKLDEFDINEEELEEIRRLEEEMINGGFD
jgi:SWI/SNF-related matrix-associated actin-dependent regulator 1 of chromatin subfamily A